MNIVGRAFSSLCVLATLTLTAATSATAATAVCHVVDPTGKPVVGATVYVFDWSHINAPTTLVTDSTGSFTTDVSESGPSTGRGTICMVVANGLAPSGGSLAAGVDTIHLTLPETVAGTVVDANGKPVAGVSVSAGYATASTNVNQDSEFSTYMVGSMAAKFTTKTDASGSFAISDLPANESISLEAAMPGYVSASVFGTKADIAAKPLVLQPGTSISGKLIREDGKSAAGILVSASQQAGKVYTQGNAASAADGTFKIEGLLPGLYVVRVSSGGTGGSGDEWVSPDPISVSTTLDQPGVAPHIVLKAGVLVSGSIVDAITNEPVPQVQIGIQKSESSQFPEAVNVWTDANGRFSVHVWPGKDSMYIYDVPADYATVSYDTEPPGFTAVEGQPLTLAPFKLQPGLLVTGTVVDDNGSPVPNFPMLPQRENNSDYGGNLVQQTDQQGSFTLHQLTPGNYYIDPGRDWTVVSPLTFTVPATTPIKFVLKRVLEAPLMGTVVDTSGLPIGGVSVQVLINHMLPNQSESGSYVTAISGSDGKFTILGAPLETTLIQSSTASEDGYVFQSGGDVVASGASLTMTPIVMAQLGGIISGIVKNGLGEPVPGAWVFSPTGSAGDVPVQADSQGRFKLTDLIVGPVDVYAGKGRYFGDLTVQATRSSSDTTTIDLSSIPTLSAPTGLAAGLQMINAAYSSYMKPGHDQSREGWYRVSCAADLAPVDHNAALNFIGRYAEVNTGDLQSIIPAASAYDPVGTAKWAIPLLQRTPGNGSRGTDAASLGLAVAPFDKSAASTLYDMAVKGIRLDRSDDFSMQNAAELVALAYALNKPEADDDFLAATANLDRFLKNEKSVDSEGDWVEQNFIEQLALGNLKLAQQMAEKAPENVRTQALSQIVEELADTNPDGALAALQALGTYQNDGDSSWAYENALCYALPLIFKTDPHAAVAQAAAIADPQPRSTALTVVADLLPMNQAESLYKEAESDSIDNDYQNSTPASIAAHAYLRDQTLGISLFKEAFNKVITLASNQNGQSPTYSSFAFYYSRVDPAYSRLLLENQFAIDLRAKNYSRTPGDSTVADVAAMAAIDVDRATAMAAMIPDQNAQFFANLAISEYVLVSPQTRSTLSFSSWMNNMAGPIGPPGIW